jgi:DnaK suppressor protein
VYSQDIFVNLRAAPATFGVARFLLEGALRILNTARKTPTFVTRKGPTMALGTPVDLNTNIEERLLRERKAVITRMQSMAEGALDLEIDIDGVPPSSYNRDEALNVMLSNRLGEIDGALERIASGNYGVCSTCSGTIPPRRLEALPFATLCVSCQSVADKRVKRYA